MSIQQVATKTSRFSSILWNLPEGRVGIMVGLVALEAATLLLLA